MYSKQVTRNIKNTPKICEFCKGSASKGVTTITVELGFGVMVIRQAPATVCSQCGEEWLDDATSAKVEGIVNAIKTYRLRKSQSGAMWRRNTQALA